MELVVAIHPSAQEHDTGRNHPESPARETAVRNGLADATLDRVEIISPAAERSDLEAVHHAEYIEMIQAFCGMGGGALDIDTIASRGSWEAAITAAGAVRAIVESLEQRDDATGFAVTRPPGHHALADQAMGFCLFNNVVVASTWLRSRGLRVAILDWDVHHGNGTEAMVASDPDVLYVSLHQSPFYPFDGQIESIDSAAEGTVVNIPLPAGTAGDVYREAWETIALPVLESFSADWVLVSAGYDAHHQDPLAGMRLLDDDYGSMASTLAGVHPPNRTVFALEGGYDLDALRGSARSTVEGVAGTSEPGPPLMSVQSSPPSLDVVRGAVARHHRIP